MREPKGMAQDVTEAWGIHDLDREFEFTDASGDRRVQVVSTPTRDNFGLRRARIIYRHLFNPDYYFTIFICYYDTFIRLSEYTRSWFDA